MADMQNTVIPVLTGAFLALACAGDGLAQDVQDPQTTEAPAPSADIAAEPQFNPRPFLTAMVNYRMLAFSCENVLPGSPLADSAEITQFFSTLGQQAPVGSDDRMDRIIYTLVRSQSASICTENLQQAALEYGLQAQEYDQARPESWPLPPRISAGPWCQSESCAELR